MGFRRNKSETLKDKRWREFIAENQRFIEKSGIPESVVSTREMFYDFLMHGYIDHHHDPSRFDVDRLSNEKFEWCIKLIEQAVDAGFIRREELSSIKVTLHSSLRPFCAYQPHSPCLSRESCPCGNDNAPDSRKA